MAGKTIKQIAASIAAELHSHPDRWTQGYNAKDRHGLLVDSRDEQACAWCLLGHIKRRSPLRYCGRRNSMEFGFTDADEMTMWNDKSERTVADIIARCEAVANG